MKRIPLHEAPGAPCANGANPSCAWHHHGYKHFPATGLVREDTRHGPAKYVALMAEQIRELETETARRPDVRHGAPPGRAEYLRQLESSVGWDLAEDASLSFVECSGGPVGSRAYHGRPVHETNRKAIALQRAGSR